MLASLPRTVLAPSHLFHVYSRVVRVFLVGANESPREGNEPRENVPPGVHLLNVLLDARLPAPLEVVGRGLEFIGHIRRQSVVKQSVQVGSLELVNDTKLVVGVPGNGKVLDGSNVRVFGGGEVGRR